MNISIKLGQVEESKPIVLRNVWPKKTLAVRIGKLLVEVWEPQKRNAELYACLRIGDGERFKVILNPMQVSIIMGAIDEWRSLWTSGFKSKGTSCLSFQIESLAVRLYNLSRGRAPRAELVLTDDKGLGGMVMLTHTEAIFLRGTIGVIVPEYEDACPQRDVEA